MYFLSSESPRQTSGFLDYIEFGICIGIHDITTIFFVLSSNTKATNEALT